MISNLEAPILGLVHEGFRYGYEMEKIIEERNMRNWTEIAFSSIYYVLKKLEKKELITSDTERISGRSRKIYQVTPQGEKALKEKIRELTSNYQQITDPFDLGIGFLDRLPHEEIIASLRSYIDSLEEHERFLEGRLADIEKSDWPPHIRGLVTRPLAMLGAEKKWVEGYIRDLERYHLEKEESHESR